MNKGNLGLERKQVLSGAIKYACTLLLAASLFNTPCLAADAPRMPAPQGMGAMDMKNCPMMMKQKHQSYIGSAAVISDDFIWKLSPNRVPQAGKPVVLNFDIVWKKDKTPLKDLQIVHEKPCHLIIVSRDLAEFQHIHPDVTGPGKMTVTTEFPKAGQYKMYMQFTVKGDGEYTIVHDLQVGSTQVKTQAARLNEDTSNKLVEGYTMRLTERPSKTNMQGPLEVAIEKNAKPVKDIERYLGAGGHGVMISEDLSQFLHIHPMLVLAQGVPYESPVMFQANVPKPGKYRAWMQFQVKGKMVIGTWDLLIRKPQD